MLGAWARGSGLGAGRFPGSIQFCSLLLEIYKILIHFCTAFHLGTPTSAPWDSNLKTKKSAAGKRPPDEAHGSGDETIRPQRSSEAEGSSEKKVQLLHRSEKKIG